MKQRTISMTSGPLGRNILVFSLPLMLSNILQVLFNMSDIAVVGRFAGPVPLGSVGSCAILVSLFTGLLIGMGSGINAITARYVGAKDAISLQKTVHAAFLISLLYGLVIMVLGMLIAKPLLLALHTKQELLPGAVRYLTVYLCGTPALALYNFGNGVLSAAGDSKRPLYYLLFAGVLNIALNLFFVIVCQLSVLGVALASAISQYLSAGLILLRLATCRLDYGLRRSAMRLDRAAARQILLLGLPAAMQNAIFALANLFIQAAVNSFDTLMVEGNSAAANADTLIYDMMAAVYVACTSFIAQNYGAGNRERIRKTYLLCTLFSFCFAALAGVLLKLFSSAFLSLFTDDAAVIAAGQKRLGIMCWSYCVSAFMDCTIAASRGLGKTIVPTVMVILGSCVFRIIWVYTVFAHFHTIASLYLLYVCSWTITASAEILYFVSLYRKTFPRERISAPQTGANA